MRTAIIGADGQLGSDLCKTIPGTEQLPLTIKDIDITDPKACRAVLNRHKPAVVINAAAFTGVDDCEDNDIDAYRVNAHGAKNLALACRDINASLLHISTDYVFDGEKGAPYAETDTPNPKNAYGVSKLAGELFVRYILPEHYIVRTSGLYGAAGCMGKGGGNFVENMLKRAKSGQKIKVVNDEILTPTYTYHLAKNIAELIKTGKYGLYHITNNGQCSWWEFTKKIFELSGINAEVEKTTAAEYKTKASRPKFSVLENEALGKIGLDLMPSWEDGLREYISARK